MKIAWIKNGICKNKGQYICNLGYACDGCPYNPELKKLRGKKKRMR